MATYNISTSTVLPWNQNYICNGSSLTASSQLTIQKASSNLIGQQLFQLSSVNVLVPSSSQVNGTQTLSTTTTPLVMVNQTTPTAVPKNMLITSEIYYYGPSAALSDPIPFKQFSTTFGLSGGSLSPGVEGTVTAPNYFYLAIQVLDPSTCSTPSLVPVTPTTGDYWWASQTAVSTAEFVSVSVGATDNMTIVSTATVYPTAVIYSFPYSINISNNSNSNNSPYNWVLVSIPYTTADPTTAITLDAFNISLNTLTPTLASAPF
jgi:hypothetical protein